MGLFTRKTKSLIALDISATTLSAMLVEQQGNGIKVAGFSTHNTAANDAEQTTVKVAIQHIISRLPTSSRQVALAIPEQLTITQQLSFKQPLTDDEVETAVRLQAADYLSCLGNELYLDFERLPQGGDSQQTDIKMIAVRKHLIDQKLNLLIALKLTPIIVDIQSACFLRAVQVSTPQLRQHKNTTVIKLNADRISFYDFAYDTLQAQRSITTEEQPTDEFKLDLINQHLEEKFNADVKSNQVLLAGNDLPSHDTIAEINQRPNIHAKIITPPKNIHFTDASPTTYTQWPQYLSLFGLALRGLPAWQ